MSDKWLSDSTRMALGLAGRCLAADMIRASGEAEATGFMERARAMTGLLDELEIGDDEEVDADMEALTLGPGELWMQVARDGIIDRLWIDDVLRYYRPKHGLITQKARLLMQYIELADAEELGAMALAWPEYVGLTRAVMSGGADVLDELADIVGVRTKWRARQ